MNDNAIYLRIYAAVPDERAAKVVLEAIAENLKLHCRIEQSIIKRYWKIQRYFEIYFLLEPIGAIAIAFQSLLEVLGTGWEVHRFNDGGDWAVWNARENSSFSKSEVRWANLECVKNHRE
jgi:hypothetical protein